MREIKFRYTCKRDNGFIFSQIFTLEEIERGVAFTWANANLVDIDKVIKEQFTGLLDANGREIYEGDIVQCSGAKYYRLVVYLGAVMMHSSWWFWSWLSRELKEEYIVSCALSGFATFCGSFFLIILGCGVC